MQEIESKVRSEQIPLRRLGTATSDDEALRRVLPAAGTLTKAAFTSSI